MIAKIFIIAKTFRAYGTNFFRQDKSLRDNGHSRPALENRAYFAAKGVAEYGLSALRAQARVENVGSRTVLTRTGFVPTGETVLSGLPAITYRLKLT
jgi:hypothetical protein